MARSTVPKAIYRRRDPETGERRVYRKVYSGGRVEDIGRGGRVTRVYRKKTAEELRREQVGLTGEFYRVTPEDLARYGSVEMAIEAQRMRGMGSDWETIEQGRKMIEARSPMKGIVSLGGRRITDTSQSRE
ncbi:MAG: hypothetical protein B6U72_02890, partial [Candidatus Altiarchaeales archaeon ex4484_2]